MKSIDKMSIPELRELNEAIAKAIVIATARERDGARKEILALAAARGFSLTELMTAHPKGLRLTMAAKYRDSKTGVTWVGRGRMPRNFDRSRAEAVAA